MDEARFAQRWAPPCATPGKGPGWPPSHGCSAGTRRQPAVCWRRAARQAAAPQPPARAFHPFNFTTSCPVVTRRCWPLAARVPSPLTGTRRGCLRVKGVNANGLMAIVRDSYQRVEPYICGRTTWPGVSGVPTASSDTVLKFLSFRPHLSSIGPDHGIKFLCATILAAHKPARARLPQALG